MATLSGLPLPRPIQEDILARLPILWLGSARHTCKLWNRITRTQRFRKMWDKERRSRGEGFMLPFIATGRYTLALDVKQLNIPPPITKCVTFKGAFLARADDPIDGKCLVSSSGGLLLFYSKDETFIVVNPVTRKTKVLPKPQPSSVLSQIGVIHHGDSYQVFVLALVDSENGVEYKQTLVGFGGAGETVNHYETLVKIYDSTTNGWRYHKSRDPKLSEGWFCPAQLKLSFKGKIYCIPTMHNNNRIVCFDTELMRWRSELTIDPPPGKSMRAISEYKGRLMTVVESTAVDVFHDWGRRGEQGTQFFVLDEVKKRWEFIQELPKQLIPDDAIVLDVWGWENKFMLMLAKSKHPGGILVDSHSATCQFMLYDLETKAVTLPMDPPDLPFGMCMIEDLVSTPRLIFEPSLSAAP